MSGHNIWRITIDTNPEDCNLQCVMCEEHSPHSDFISTLYKTTGVKKRRMPVEWIGKIFLEAKRLGVTEIIPSTMGEPLLYKDFELIVDLCHKHDIKLNLTTNGTFPRKSVSEWAELIVPVTSDVKISWNGATSKIAEDIMSGIDYERAVQNVKEFVRFRNLHHFRTGYYCRITFQLTFMKNNMHELADIVKLAAELDIDRVKGHHLWTHFSETENLSMKHSDESMRLWNQYVREAYSAQEKYRKPDGQKVILENIIPITKLDQQNVPQHYECPFLNKELWISATGKISPCCAPDNLRQSLGDFGNYPETSLNSVVQSAAYQNLVAGYKSNSLCKSCNMRKP